METKDFGGMIEVLYDVKNGGVKEIPWKARRLITLRLAQAYKRIDSPKYSRIINCAGYLEFRRYADNSLKLQTANFCQTRLCPMCNWRRSRKVFAQVASIMSKIKTDYQFIFLTLTVKNISGANLSKQIDTMYYAFKKLALRVHFKNAVMGWAKCFEITYNWETKEFHPHFHCILAVDKNYFTSKNLYIEQNDWCLMWQSCLNVDYKPIVYIQSFTESEKGKGKEIAEVAKYTIKSSNIMANLRDIKPYSQDIQDEVKRLTNEITDDIVMTLDASLNRRRLIEFGGIIKKIHKELNLDDVSDAESDDLVHTENERGKGGLAYEVERYRWDIGLKNYVMIEENREDDS